MQPATARSKPDELGPLCALHTLASVSDQFCEKLPVGSAIINTGLDHAPPAAVGAAAEVYGSHLICPLDVDLSLQCVSPHPLSRCPACLAALNAACRLGDEQALTQLLALGGARTLDVSVHQHRAFFTACRHGQVSALLALLALEGPRQLPMPGVGNTALQLACRHGQLGVVRALLALTGAQAVDASAGQDKALREACRKGHPPVVAELLGLTGGRQVDVNAVSSHALYLACQNGHVEVLQQLLALEGGRRVHVQGQAGGALLAASKNGHSDMVRQLLALSGDREVDVSAAGMCSLLAACSGGHAGVVEAFLSQPTGRLASIGADHMRLALMCHASKHDQINVVAVLLQHLDFTGDSGRAALQRGAKVACAQGSERVLALLLALIGECEIQLHDNGSDLLQAACSAGQLGAMRQLLALTGARRMGVHCGLLAGAAVAGHGDVIREFMQLTGERRLQDPERLRRLLLVGCMWGHVGVVAAMLPLTRPGDGRLQPLSDDAVPLATAAKAGSLQLLGLLLSQPGVRIPADLTLTVEPTGTGMLRLCSLLQQLWTTGHASQAVRLLTHCNLNYSFRTRRAGKTCADPVLRGLFLACLQPSPPVGGVGGDTAPPFDAQALNELVAHVPWTSPSWEHLSAQSPYATARALLLGWLLRCGACPGGGVAALRGALLAARGSADAKLHAVAGVFVELLWRGGGAAAPGFVPRQQLVLCRHAGKQ